LAPRPHAALEACDLLSGVVKLHGGATYAERALRSLAANARAMRGFDAVLFLHKRHAVTWPLWLAGRVAGARVLHHNGYRYADPRRTARSDFPEYVLFQKVAADLLLQEPLSRLMQPRLEIAERDRRAARRFLERHAPVGPRVIINTQSNLPDWGIERYAAVANALTERGADVIINGGSSHQVEEYRRVAASLSPRVALLERPTPGELAAVIDRSDVYIGAANGPSSVAMALDTPTVALVGPGEHRYPAQERIGPPWWPRGDRHVVIARNDWCYANRAADCRCQPLSRPARWQRSLKRGMKHTGVRGRWRRVRRTVRRWLPRAAPRAQRPRPYPCLEAISVEEVLEAALERLDLDAAGTRTARARAAVATRADA
jgi:ADP-heptose:LPS heptosyltransferase